MKEMILLFQELLVLYGIGVIGFVCKKINLFQPSADIVFSNLLLYVTLPCLILFSMDIPFTSTILSEFYWLILLSSGALCLASILAYLLATKCSLSSNRNGVFQSLIIFGNQGFIGYGICYILFGEKGILYAAFFNFPYLLLIWSYGIYLISKSAGSINWKELFLNPGIISTCVGSLIFIVPGGWPIPLLNMFKMVGEITIPLSMLFIGCLLANLKIKEIGSLLKNKYLWISSVCKCLINPLLLFPLLFTTIPSGLVLVAILITATPSAPTTSIYAQRYGGDRYFASTGVLISTLLASICIPVLYGLGMLLL
ncbi:AEC family transporter [Bacillus sp. Marseille-P3661]|uniref:AEC family transporter n=1 Tax=Bacillus sp. Marseille-P3661 TaxID=1936234 RepID=UPI000C81A6A0|nr:AEC family transporter [Bacillus sp. Marseille-P3661]